MKKIIFSVLSFTLVSSAAMASNLICDTNSEYQYSNLVFKKTNTTDSGFIVLVSTSSGKAWVPAYEQFIVKRNGFRLRGIVEEGKVFEACGELNSDGLSISKISKK